MSDDARTPAGRETGPLERERIVELLCDHYAADHLGMTEFERRVDDAHRARTREELRAVLDGLPPLSRPGPGGTAGRPAAPGDPRQASSPGGPSHPDARPTHASPSERLRSRYDEAARHPAEADHTAHDAARGANYPAQSSRSHHPTHPGDHARSWVALDPHARVPERQSEVAVFSGRVRKGGWIPARKIRGLAMMGGLELDFREAQLPPGEIHVMVSAVMGGVDVIVPPGVRVETDGFAFLGGFDEDVDAYELAEPDAPIIRITGFALLGGVDVTCRYPGESPRQARRRRKEDQRLKKEEHRRRLGPG